MAQVPLTPLAAPELVPSRGSIPVLLSVPHAGRAYPDWLVDLASGGRAALETLEDPLVDRLVERALDRGVGAVIAQAPRAAIDCNRSEEEFDPAILADPRFARPTPRARGGLGIVPSRTQQHGALWRRPIATAHLDQRLEQAHRPYHRLIEEQLDALVRRFGCALLLDCHSMPPPPRGVPSVVIGDCHGRSAARWITDEALRLSRQEGFPAALNDPFAGGYVIERHGAPHRGIHALQIEIDRRCYLADGRSRPSPGFNAAARLLERLTVSLGDRLLERETPAAAE